MEPDFARVQHEFRTASDMHSRLTPREMVEAQQANGKMWKVTGTDFHAVQEDDGSYTAVLVHTVYI